MENPYAHCLGDRDPVKVMAATPSIVYAHIAPLLADQAGLARLNQPPAPGKWSLREILAHLADCEIAFGFRLRQALAGPITAQPFDQDLWAKHYAPCDAPTALSTYVTLRNWNMLLIQSLGADDLAAPYTHPELGTGIVRDLLEVIAGHDLNHLERLGPLLAAPK